SKLSYRQKLKEQNPEKYREYLNQQKRRSKNYRTELSKSQTPSQKEKLDKYKENARLRQQKYRTGKKESNNEPTPVRAKTEKKPKTRNEVKFLREKWAHAKQKWRAKLSNTHKRWLREKDKQAKMKKKNPTGENSIQKSPSVYGCKKTLFNNASSAKKALPKSPTKFATKQKKYPAQEKNTIGSISYGIRLSSKLKKRSINISKVKYLSQTIQRRVAEFYLATSRPLPNKRYATKFGPAYLMQLTLKSAYRQFLAEHPNMNVGFTKFTLLRPKNVRLLNKSHWQFCVCVSCQNVKYKITALNAFASKVSVFETKIDNEISGFMDIVLCAKSDTSRFHAISCIYKQCNACEDFGQTIREHYKPLLELESHQKVVWHHWERTEEGGIVRKRLTTKKGSLNQAVQELVKDFESPTIIVRDAMIFVSDDLKHDYFAVQHYFQKAESYLREHIPVKKLFVFSDGCASQYKSKGSMASLSLLETDIDWNYFGSDHGKSEADGELGSLNRAVDKAILGRQVIVSGAEDLQKWCNSKDNLMIDEPGVKRHFHLVDIDEVNRSGDETFVQTMKGIRNVHQVRNTKQTYELKTRRLSCFCLECQTITGKCINSEVVGEYTHQVLVKSNAGTKKCLSGANKHLDKNEIKVEAQQKNGKAAGDADTGPKTRRLGKGKHLDEKEIKFEAQQKNGKGAGDADTGHKTRRLSKGKPACKTDSKIIAANNHLDKVDIKVKALQINVERKSATDADFEARTRRMGKVIAAGETDSKNISDIEHLDKVDKRVEAQQKNVKRKAASDAGIGAKTRRMSKVIAAGENLDQVEAQQKHDKRKAACVLDIGAKTRRLSKDDDIILGEVNRDSIFKKLQAQLASCKAYKELDDKVRNMHRQQPELPEQNEITFVSSKRPIDKTSVPLVKKELIDAGMYPTTIFGDGNCLPRCASLLVYGTEEKYTEMRVRIVLELVYQADKYLEDRYLKAGGSISKDVAKRFAMFSDKYTAQRLTKQTIRHIFQSETLGICKSGAYMGIWQLASLANILMRKVISHYPIYGGRTVHHDLDRYFVPFAKSGLTTLPPVTIMWTHIDGCMLAAKEWFPNHFVVLLRTDKHSTCKTDYEATNMETDDEEENNDTEMGSSWLSDLLLDVDISIGDISFDEKIAESLADSPVMSTPNEVGPAVLKQSCEADQSAIFLSVSEEQPSADSLADSPVMSTTEEGGPAVLKQSSEADQSAILPSVSKEQPSADSLADSPVMSTPEEVGPAVLKQSCEEDQSAIFLSVSEEQPGADSLADSPVMSTPEEVGPAVLKQSCEADQSAIFLSVSEEQPSADSLADSPVMSTLEEGGSAVLKQSCEEDQSAIFLSVSEEQPSADSLADSPVMSTPEEGGSAVLKQSSEADQSAIFLSVSKEQPSADSLADSPVMSTPEEGGPAVLKQSCEADQSAIFLSVSEEQPSADSLADSPVMSTTEEGGPAVLKQSCEEDQSAIFLSVSEEQPSADSLADSPVMSTTEEGGPAVLKQSCEEDQSAIFLSVSKEEPSADSLADSPVMSTPEEGGSAVLTQSCEADQSAIFLSVSEEQPSADSLADSPVMSTTEEGGPAVLKQSCEEDQSAIFLSVSKEQPSADSLADSPVMSTTEEDGPAVLKQSSEADQSAIFPSVSQEEPSADSLADSPAMSTLEEGGSAVLKQSCEEDQSAIFPPVSKEQPSADSLADSPVMSTLEEVGQAEEQPSSSSGYLCQCPAGFTGHNCDQADNPCIPDPCSAHGNCERSSGGGGYACTCFYGYTGLTCAA
ncbi:VRTN-like protein, partial [Mya arenaria]